VLQRFRDEGNEVIEWQLSDAEIQVKKQMMAEYNSQRGTVSTFDPSSERMRLAANDGSAFSAALCRSYLHQERRPRFYHSRRHRLPAKVLLKKFAKLEVSKPLNNPDHA
jgi:hypothetical protein